MNHPFGPNVLGFDRVIFKVRHVWVKLERYYSLTECDVVQLASLLVEDTKLRYTMTLERGADSTQAMAWHRHIRAICNELQVTRAELRKAYLETKTT